MQKTVIPTPLRQQLRRAASQGLPVLAFLGSCMASAWLWQYQTRASVLVGEVEVVEFVVSSPQAGIVANLAPSDGTALGVYVSVAENQLLMQLDDTEARRQFQQLHGELIKVSDEIGKEVNRLNTLEALVMREIAIQLDAPDGTDAGVDTETDSSESASDSNSDSDSEAESDSERNRKTEPLADSDEAKIWQTVKGVVEQSISGVRMSQKELDLRQTDFELQQARSAHAAGKMDDATFSEYEQLRKSTSEEIFELRTSIHPDHLAELDEIEAESLSTTSRLMLRSLMHRLRDAEMKLEVARETAGRLDVVSPIAGQIEETMVQQRQAVTSGQPLLSVVPQRGKTVIVYAREQSLIRPFAGMSVTLRSRANPQQQMSSVVEFVGPKVEEIPSRLRVNPKQVEWGRPMRIPIPAEWILEPGSLIDVVVEPI